MRILITIIFTLATSLVRCQALVPLDEGSRVIFKIKNLGFTTDGSFKGLSGKINYSGGAPATTSFDVSIDANTIDTDNNTRDNHLRKEAYFDVKNYPLIRFVSSRVANGDKAGTLIVFGKLTIKKVTKEVSFPFTAKAAKDGIRFRGEFRINRRDFDVGGGSTIADNLLVCLDIITKRT